MLIRKSDLDKMNRIYRTNLINSVTGITPANLIGTRSKEEQDNLAIFSSVVHLGSNPALIGIVTRPQKPNLKDTYSNILETGFYTINHISETFIRNAHYTSAKLERKVSEFDVMNLERAFIEGFFAPFVKESAVKIGMKFLQRIGLPNGCDFIIGEVTLIQVLDTLVDEEGQLDLAAYEATGVAGVNSYYGLKKLATFPYVKLDQIPDFHA